MIEDRRELTFADDATIPVPTGRCRQDKMDANNKDTMILEVAIIGAGPAGLIAAKQLKEICGFSVIKPTMEANKVPSTQGESSANYQGKIAIFEESSSVGGIWNLNPHGLRQDVPCTCRDPEADPAETINVEASPQPIYEHLRTNLPKDLSSFSDQPFPSDLEFFPPPQKLEDYYQSYSRKHELESRIFYNARIVKCWKDSNNNNNNSWIGLI